MTALSSQQPSHTDVAVAVPGAMEPNWVAALSTPGPEQEVALRRLHALLLRAARLQVSRMSAMSAAAGRERVEEIVQSAADDALVQVLRRLPSFEGRSRFTTWAYKFAILQAAVELRRHAWVGRDIPLEAAPQQAAADPTPEHYAEAADLARGTRTAIDVALTPHQRRILLAIVVDDVPIDVLAHRLNTTRNALYKTLHDARCRVRAHLVEQGYLSPNSPKSDGVS